METTPLFPADIKPCADRPGVYGTEFKDAYGAVLCGFSWWDGERWGGQYHTPRQCVNASPSKVPRQDKEWYGLTEESKS